MDEALEQLSQKIMFHCSRRDGMDGEKNIEVVHTFSEPLNIDPIPEWVTPSLLMIYKQWHGLSFFQPAYETEVENGFRLFNINEVQEERNNLDKIFKQNIAQYSGNSNFKDLDKWLEWLVPIGEVMSSGDKFVLDVYHRNKEGECPILFLDHEAYFGDCCDPDVMSVIAPDAMSFLKMMLKNPLKYLAPHWVGGNYNEQWYPDAMTVEPA